MRRSSALALAFVAVGCTLAPAAPEVEVAVVELRGLGLLDQAFGVMSCVSNPGNAALSSRRVTAALQLAGAPLAEIPSEALRVPPRSSMLVLL